VKSITDLMTVNWPPCAKGSTPCCGTLDLTNSGFNPHPFKSQDYVDTSHANIGEENLPKAFSEYAAEIAHIHVAKNDRGVPGRGHIDFSAIFRASKSSGYHGWLTIEAFGRTLPDLVEPTRVWRDFFKHPDEVVTEGYRFIRETWNAA
jgi:D-psicose/D-tagatose/L-ribulose 3-epimerase